MTESSGDPGGGGTVRRMDFNVAVYALITAIEEGKLAEGEVVHRVIREDCEETIEVAVRSAVRHFAPVEP